MLDIIALTGLDWLYDIVENRYGRVAASVTTIALALGVVGVLVWIFVAVLGR